MKGKIERFSQGDFEYEQPFLCLSEEEIKMVVEAGKPAKGCFTVKGSTGREMKGMVYSSNRLMLIDNPAFVGADHTIHFQFNATFLKEGELIEGEFCIVSDCGEAILPFSIRTESYYCMTSLGKIKDLFQFTNLARMDWSEAKKVFRSEEFERIFLFYEERYRFVYRNLIKSISTSQALEEFLIAIHKKAAIRLEIDRTKVEYHLDQNVLSDKLILTKNNWGYAEIRVSTDVPFIQLEQKFLWADRFVGNTHHVAYHIDPKNLKIGNNFGHIFIKTAGQTIIVEVTCKYRREANKISENRVLQKFEYGLVDNYLSFRLNRIDLTEYLNEAEILIKQLPGPEVNRYKELMKIHLSIVAGRTKIAKELLEDIASDEIVLKQKSVLTYCTYLYLDALYRKDEETIKHAADTIRDYYEKGNSDWRLLWFLFYLDKRYEKNKSAKLSDIKEQFEAGCRSPILYYEAVCIYNEEPFLLRELTEFEVQVLNFGIKNWILSKETARQYTYLSTKKKNYEHVIYNGLCKLYDEYASTEILSAICSMLIKGMKKAEKYFEWYRLGVDAQLRITELYEYYMYSISDTQQEPLPQPILLYFIYNSSLNDKKKAFLYSNIVKYKDKYESIYRSYYKRMEVFTAKMLESHQVSPNLALLYREFLNMDLLNSELSRHLPFVMYRNELMCNNPGIVNAIILHRELGIEETIQLVEGKTQVDIYTNNVEIFLVDSFGNRFVESIEYSVTPYMNSEEYENHCISYSNNPMLLLHLFNRYESHRVMNENAIALRKKVLLIEGLSKEYETRCCQTLIEYYYENYDDELLEQYLGQIDLYLVRHGDRTKFLEYMLIRSFYDKALESLEVFGLEGIPINRLVKLCSGWVVASGSEEKHDNMVNLCHYVFAHRKYDEAILNYLVKYYDGATREMFKLWKAAREFELNTHTLEERLLTQMLFTESYIEDSFLVFSTYYRDVTNHVLVRAFLTYFAYKFLVHNHVIDTELFPIMKRELYYEENDICLLAWLKHNSTNKKLIASELVFAEYNIKRLVRKGIVLPFFLDYRNNINLPDRILDQCYITYHSDPRKQVYIHYRLLKQNNPEYITERLPNVLLGIHVKEFVLFYHEIIQYYITEESAEGTNITESFHLQNDCDTPEEEESKYNQINLMLIAMEMQDDNTLLAIMENYVKNEYMIAECFKQIENLGE